MHLTRHGVCVADAHNPKMELNGKVKPMENVNELTETFSLARR